MSGRSNDRVPVILDVDTGIDDALALAFAVNAPECDLLAVTTLAGNVGVEKTTRNTLDVLGVLGANDVPVHRGASRPLVRPHRDAVYYHDVNGLGGAALPTTDRPLGADRGPAAIVRLAKERPGEVVLVCVGPLTNLAIALNVAPELGGLLRSVVVMGGAFTVPGNTVPWAEFNMLVDPEAARQVFAAGLPNLTAVGLDVTHKVWLDRTTWDAARAIAPTPESAPAAWLAATVYAKEFAREGLARTYLHDPLAVAVALDPTLVGCEDAAVTVETAEGREGATSIAGPGSVKVALSVDEERFLARIRERLGVASGRGRSGYPPHTGRRRRPFRVRRGTGRGSGVA